MRGKLGRLVSIAPILLATFDAAAQSKRVEELALGKLLVATRDAPDPNFAETVILLVQFDSKSAVGLIVNRPAKIPISRALEGLKAAHDNSDPVYIGGPVELDSVLALLRLASQQEDTLHVIGDVYLAAKRDVIEKALRTHASPDDFRAYLGYCGWGRRQLENEVGLGVWYIFKGSPNLVFDSSPGSLWSRLIGQTEQRIACNH